MIEQSKKNRVSKDVLYSFMRVVTSAKLKTYKKRTFDVLSKFKATQSSLNATVASLKSTVQEKDDKIQSMAKQL
jgi:hypothetical protein